MRLSITTNFPQVQRQLDGLQAEVGAKATARAVNATVAQARTEMVRQITREYELKANYVRPRLMVTKAKYFKGRLNIEAELYSEDKLGRERSINLINFTAKKAPAGVSVKIRKAGGRKVVKGAFIGNKGRTVFERVSGSVMNSRSKSKGKLHREAIKPKQTIHVPQMFNAKRINAAVVAAMLQKFPPIFQREVAYALATFNRA